MTKIIVFGGNGLVGSRFTDLNKDNFEIDAPLSSEVDITKSVGILKYIDKSDAEVVINFAAYTNVEEAEKEKDNKEGICYKVNTQGAKNIADACKTFAKHLIHISTEYVFDGEKAESPYTEDDSPNPINWYGMTKYIGERHVLESNCKATIVRISMPYSSFYKAKKDIARFFLEQLKNGNTVKAVEDQRITPTLVDDIANALKILIDARTLGLYHVCCKDSVTPLEFAKTIAETFHLELSLIAAVTLDQYNKNKKAKLLKYSWLNSAKFEKEFGDDVLHTAEEDLMIFKCIDSKVNN